MSNDDERDPGPIDTRYPELRALIEDVIEGRSPPSTPPDYEGPETDLRLELKGVVAAIEAREEADRTAIETEIKNFQRAVNETGELLHPYYEEVEAAMNALAQSYATSEQPIPPRAELYETAVWTNSSTRAALLASQRAAEQAKQTEEARAKAARLARPRRRPAEGPLVVVLEKHGLRDSKQGKTETEIRNLIESEMNVRTAAGQEALRQLIRRYYKRPRDSA